MFIPPAVFYLATLAAYAMTRARLPRPKPLHWAVLCALTSLGANTHAGEPLRLSDVLVQRATAGGPAQTDYSLGISWRVPSEVPAQLGQRLRLVNAVDALPLNAADRARLARWLQSHPITGRVPVAMADARWLQAHPSRDPRIAPGHTVAFPPRPRSVTVLTPAGQPCPVDHQPGQHALAYVRACSESPTSAIDWVWIAQPDGRMAKVGTGLWNEEAQDEPAPGAWLWGPGREQRIPEAFSDELIGFLATLGPALDADTHEDVFPMPPPAPTPTPADPLAGGQSRAPNSDAAFPVTPATHAARPLSAEPPPTAAPSPSPNDWGSIGLLQTPSARMMPAGDARLHVSRVAPYTRINVFAQPFDGFEAGFRYTSISNRAYGPQALSGDQSYKDKSLDGKFRLMQESAWLPQLAVGFRDVAGTGLFSGEYFVGNKRVGHADFSLGLAWGYGAGNGRMRNPLAALSPRFDRPRARSDGTGQFSVSNYFSGPASVFAGVALQVPTQPLTLKLEYDSNDYRAEPQDNTQPQKSRWNVGLSWRVSPAMDISAGVERGNTLMVAVNFHTLLDRLSTRKVGNAPLPAVSTTRPTQEPNWNSTVQDLHRHTDWHVSSLTRQGRSLIVRVPESGGTYWRERLDAATTVLHRDAPADIDEIRYTYTPYGLASAEHVVDRDQWMQDKTQPQPPSAKRAPILESASPPSGSPQPLHDAAPSRWRSHFGLGFQQSLGGPDGFSLYQLLAVHRGWLQLRDDTWLQSTLELGLIDNYDTFRYTAPSALPRVRTYLREYVTTSNVKLANLQATHVGQPSADHFYSVYGGILESMFAGVGGEWLYRPRGSRIALGVDANAVVQRDFAQHLGLRDYRTTTGHASLYWDTGWNDVQVNLKAGKYLARDLGATLEVSRGFANGVRMGAYVTKTNLSSAQFGEGSFDKGVFVAIPFDAFLTRSSKNTANFVWQPLIRDGGARLNRSVSLYELTQARDGRVLRYQSAAPQKHDSIPADHGHQGIVPTPPVARDLPARPLSAPTHTGELEHAVRSALAAQGLSHNRVRWDAPQRIEVELLNDPAQPVGRAAYRAAIAALRVAPLDTRSIRVAIHNTASGTVSYEFFDTDKLDEFYHGLRSETELAPFVAIRAEHRGANTALTHLHQETGAHETPSLIDTLPSPITRVTGDFQAAANTARDIPWTRVVLVGGGAILASHALDRRADRWAAGQPNSATHTIRRAGNAFPLLATGVAAAGALFADTPLVRRTSLAATESAATALVLASGLKLIIGRARPNAGADTATDARRSFPSNHAAVAWAVVTPYAMQYNAPILYAAPLLTQVTRVMDRKHWVSDTVAGALLGYGIGQLFFESSKRQAQRAQVVVGDSGDGLTLGLSWAF